MKFRVKEGRRFGSARPGDVVDVEPRKAALVPWCLDVEPLAEPKQPPPATPDPPKIVKPSKRR